MEGYRKIISTYTPIVVGIVNSVFVGANVPLPKDYEWPTLIAWLLVIIMQYIPTIITLISTMFYTKKNVEEAKAFAAADVAKSTAPTQTVTANVVTPVFSPVAPVQAVVATPAAPISQVKDRIESTVKLINKDTKWDFLMGLWVDKVEKAKEHMAAVNNGNIDIEKILNEYSDGVLDEEDCNNVQSVMGLPQVLHAKNDLLILQSMQEAEKKGTLSKAMSTTYLNAAVKGVTADIINEAVNRVQNDSLPVSVRRSALMEFGLTQEQADRSMFSGGQCTIYTASGYREFDPWQLTDIDPFK